MSDYRVPQQVWREDLGDMETDHLVWKQFSKLIDVRGETMLVRQKWSPQQVWREETCRQTTLETVFKVDVRENKREPEGICQTKVVPPKQGGREQEGGRKEIIFRGETILVRRKWSSQQGGQADILKSLSGWLTYLQGKHSTAHHPCLSLPQPSLGGGTDFV